MVQRREQKMRIIRFRSSLLDFRNTAFRGIIFPNVDLLSASPVPFFFLRAALAHKPHFRLQLRGPARVVNMGRNITFRKHYSESAVHCENVLGISPFISVWVSLGIDVLTVLLPSWANGTERRVNKKKREIALHPRRAKGGRGGGRVKLTDNVSKPWLIRQFPVRRFIAMKSPRRENTAARSFRIEGQKSIRGLRDGGNKKRAASLCRALMEGHTAYTYEVSPVFRIRQLAAWPVITLCKFVISAAGRGPFVIIIRPNGQQAVTGLNADDARPMFLLLCEQKKKWNEISARRRRKREGDRSKRYHEGYLHF